MLGDRWDEFGLGERKEKGMGGVPAPGHSWGSATWLPAEQGGLERPLQELDPYVLGFKKVSAFSGEEPGRDVGVSGMELECVHRQTQGGSGFRTRTH